MNRYIRVQCRRLCRVQTFKFSQRIRSFLMARVYAHKRFQCHKNFSDVAFKTQDIFERENSLTEQLPVNKKQQFCKRPRKAFLKQRPKPRKYKRNQWRLVINDYKRAAPSRTYEATNSWAWYMSCRIIVISKWLVYLRTTIRSKTSYNNAFKLKLLTWCEYQEWLAM